MERIFKSKIGFGILCIVLFAFSIPTFIMIKTETWQGLFLLVPIAAFLSLPFLGTYYKITSDKKLLITCAFYARWSINISSIYLVKKTRNPISSPALSMDRLEIFYDNGESIIVSPKEKTEFINAIKELNSLVKINL